MSLATVALGVLIIALLIGHGALYFTRPRGGGTVRQTQLRESTFTTETPQKRGDSTLKTVSFEPAHVETQFRLLNEKIRMAHARLDRIERPGSSPITAGENTWQEERLRKLENTAANNQVDLIAIRQMLDEIKVSLHGTVKQRIPKQ